MLLRQLISLVRLAHSCPSKVVVKSLLDSPRQVPQNMLFSVIGLCSRFASDVSLPVMRPLFSFMFMLGNKDKVYSMYFILCGWLGKCAVFKTVLLMYWL